MANLKNPTLILIYYNSLPCLISTKLLPKTKIKLTSKFAGLQILTIDKFTT